MERYGLLTGASSGIGLAIAKALLQAGWCLYGIGRHFSEDALQQLCRDAEVGGGSFVPVEQDLTDTGKLLELVRGLQKEHTFRLLVNNAGVAYYGPHETVSPKNLHEMVVTNVEVPMLLCGQLMRGLREVSGTIVNVSSVTATHASPWGCAYGATKAALSAFSESLFEENRKHGVRVVTIQPDMTATALYRNADFCQGEEADTYLTPEEVAEAVLYAVNAREGLVLREITLQPQKRCIKRKGASARNDMG